MNETTNACIFPFLKSLHMMCVYSSISGGPEEETHFYIKNGVVQSLYDRINVLVLEDSLPFVWYGQEAKVKCVDGGGGVGGVTHCVVLMASLTIIGDSVQQSPPARNCTTLRHTCIAASCTVGLALVFSSPSKLSSELFLLMMKF